MSDMITISRAEVDRLNRISRDAYGVMGKFDAVFMDAKNYARDDLMRVIRDAHTILERACMREEGEWSVFARVLNR